MEFDLESVNPKENTTKAIINQFKDLYLDYCSSIGIVEEVLPTKPREEVFETVQQFVACVGTKNGQFFSQSSFFGLLRNDNKNIITLCFAR